ncbi:MAG: VTT domain-containing protein [Patescibacteria group bacterium]|mgnify:CR=1 FL=1
MEIKNYKHLYLLAFLIIITIIAYTWLLNSEYFEHFLNWSRQNIILFYSVLIFLKIFGIVWPPLPGGLLTIGSIPIIGWQGAYIADITGGIIGSSIAFFIAKKWGYKFLHKIFDQVIIDRIKQIKIKPKHEIESVTVFRIFGGSIVEMVCYGAGILGIKYRNFLIGTVLSHLIIGLPFYYLVGGIIGKENVLFNLVLIAIFIPLFFFARNRYFE